MRAHELTSARLTWTELTVLAWLSYGFRNDEIACLLMMGKGTVKTHLYSAFKKGGFRNRADATRWYICTVEGRVRVPARARMLREEVA